MSKENGIPSIQGLVLFKNVKVQEEKEQDYYSYESVDQENKIKLHSELSPFGGDYRYSVLMVNQSQAPITEVKIRLKYPDFLGLNRFSPPNISIDQTETSEKGILQYNLEFDELNEGDKKQINFYFSPKMLQVNGELSTSITFVNNRDFIRVLNTDPIELNIKTITIEPKILPTFQIEKFLNSEGVKRGVKSMGIGLDSEPNFDIYYNHLIQILQQHNLQVLTKDDVNKIAWFFGSDLETKEDVLVIGQIVVNKVEFLAASKNHPVLISLLTNLADDFKKRVISAGILNSEENIYDLECKYCGAILSRFPNRGEAIECPNCKTEQLVW